VSLIWGINRIARQLVKEIVPILGVPEVLLSDSGSISSYETMSRKQAATYGVQWDQYMYGVLWPYHNTQHNLTGEKPSYLLFGMDCRSPTEAAHCHQSTKLPQAYLIIEKRW